MPKLYEVPAGSRIRVKEKNLSNEVYKFFNLDGMYSYCTDKDDKVIHLAAWTDVEIVNE